MTMPNTTRASATTGLKLSVLDLTPLPPGGTPFEGVRASLDLAGVADAAGFHRYWVAEHHDGGVQASPEIMATLIAGTTERIRVGTAGVLFSYYSPLKVANVFLLLEAAFAGRIDLGLARGGIHDARIAQGLWPRASTSSRSFERRVISLLGLLRKDRRLCTPSAPFGTPELWLLGSGVDAGRLAAKHGTAYSHGLFFNRPPVEDPVGRYLRACGDAPAACNVAIAVGCAQTTRGVRRLETLAAKNPWYKVEIVGSVRAISRRIREVAARHGVGEVVLLDVDDEPGRRQETLARLGRELELVPT